MNEAFFCDPAGIRTQDPNIKSVMLYRLSYRIISLLQRCLSIIANAKVAFFHNKTKQYPRSNLMLLAKSSLYERYDLNNSELAM